MKTTPALEKETVWPTNTISLWTHKKSLLVEAEKHPWVMYCDVNDPRATERNSEMMPAGDLIWQEYNWEAGWKYCQFPNPSILCGQHSLLLQLFSKCWVWARGWNDNFIQMLSANRMLKFLVTEGNTELYWKKGFSKQLSLPFFLHLQWRNTQIKQNTLPRASQWQPLTLMDKRPSVNKLLDFKSLFKTSLFLLSSYISNTESQELSQWAYSKGWQLQEFSPAWLSELQPVPVYRPKHIASISRSLCVRQVLTTGHFKLTFVEKCIQLVICGT